MHRSGFKYFVVLVWGLFAVAVFLYGAPQITAGSEEDYHSLVAASYDFKFGKERPFAPSNATTFNGKFIRAKDFAPASRCATCHTDIHPQWNESAHARSFADPFYQKNVKDLENQKGIAFTRHCESCHNPIALFSGALTDKPFDKDRSYDADGVSCTVCHSIEAVTGRGIGGYIMGQPALIVDEDGTRIINASDEDITNDIDGHRRAMMNDVLRKPEFCASCHKSQVPRELNDYKFLRAFMVGDEHQRSSFSKESPHPFYTREKQSCNSCHMERVPTENYDVSVKDDTIMSHRFAAANVALPMVYGYKKQFEEVVRFLKDDKVAVDIFALHRQAKGSSNSKMFAPVNKRSFRVKSGDTLTADVVVTNKNIGHSFPPELRDFYEAFIEFSVETTSGDTLYKSGYFRPDGYLEESAHDYKTYLVTGEGEFNDLHHIWRTKVVAQNRAIQSGRSDVTRYRFVVPEDFDGELVLRARLNYRRFTRVYSDYVIGRPFDLPVVTMAEAEERVKVGERTRSSVRSGMMPDWWRWNNYGIALLDNKQFPQAADAFDEVIDFKGEYRENAYVNKALALMEMGGWKEARKLIAKSLKANPENMRTVFQDGRINKVFSRLDEAEERFTRVLEKYPNDRDTLQQLGELAKLRSETVSDEERLTQLEKARGFYRRILEIDPEDVSGVYNLMLLNQKLGNRKKAAELSRVFRDLKADPQVAFIAREFLEKNPALSNESIPFHVHDLAPFRASLEIGRYPVLSDIDWSERLKTTADFVPVAAD